MKQSLRQPNYVESMRLTAVADFPRRKTEVFEEFPLVMREGGIGKSGGGLNGRLIQLLHRQWEHPRQSGTRESNTKPDPSLGNDSTQLNSTRLTLCGTKKSQKLKVQFCRYYFTFTTKGRQKIKKKQPKNKSEKLLNYFMQRANR